MFWAMVGTSDAKVIGDAVKSIYAAQKKALEEKDITNEVKGI
jgi:hypothetical protein